MPARLIVYPQLQPTRSFALLEGRSYVVGRQQPDTELPDVAIDDDRISRRHAVLSASAVGGWTLEDQGSKNGVEIEGRAVADVTLPDDAWISFGGVLARFQVVDAGQLASDRADREHQWRVSAELQRALEPSLGVEPLLERLLDSVLELSRTDRGFVLWAETNEGREVAEEELRVAATRGVGRQQVAERSFLGSSGVVRRVLETGEATASCDAAADTWLGSRASVLTGGIRALVCLPLRVEGATLGAVYADSRSPGAMVSDLDLEVLSALAEHAALALSVARMDREIDALVAQLSGAGSVPDPALRSELARRLSALRRGAQ